jgi:putative sporulation protein YtxC
MCGFVLSAQGDAFSIVKTWANRELLVCDEWQQGDYGFVTIQLDRNIGEEWAFSHKVAELILDHLRRHWIRRFLWVYYAFFDLVEQRVISDRAWEILGDKLEVEKIHEQTALCVYDWVEDSTELIVDGFTRFRLPWFWIMLQEAVDQSVDVFLLEKEFNEFIRLLRYFVDMQEPRTSVVHILPGVSNSVELVDGAGNTVQQEYVEQTAYYFEDLIVSALVNMAPRRIIIHVSQQSDIVNIISKVFTERVRVCTGCPLCQGKTP